MKIFFSGGSAIAETGIEDPYLMFSYYVTVKNGKPDKRLRRVLNIRQRAKGIVKPKVKVRVKK